MELKLSTDRVDVEQVIEDLMTLSSRFSNGIRSIESLIKSVQKAASYQEWERDLGISLMPGASANQLVATIHGRVVQIAFKCFIQDNSAIGIARAHLVSEFPEIEGWCELGGFKFLQQTLLDANINGEPISGITPQTPAAAIVLLLIKQACHQGFGPPANPPRP